jgi:hypothetical protein
MRVVNLGAFSKVRLRFSGASCGVPFARTQPSRCRLGSWTVRASRNVQVRAASSFPRLEIGLRDTSQSVRSAAPNITASPPGVNFNKRETGMPLYDTASELCRTRLGKNHQELAQFIEGHINRVANGRIRDLHVVYSDDMIILQGRSRTYHAKQLAHQAVLDLTDGHPLLANQIVVS